MSTGTQSQTRFSLRPYKPASHPPSDEYFLLSAPCLIRWDSFHLSRLQPRALEKQATLGARNPEPYSSQWLKWLEELYCLNGNPRCYKTQYLGATTILQLHNFADASRHGYAAVSCLWFVDEQGVIHCSFVTGKTRNAPIKEWTIPHLELQATVLAVRLSNSILRELDLQVEETFWSDSMTPLQYIKNQTRRFHTFVANRMAEFQETTFPEQWHYLPGSIDPADDGSRGVSAQHFQPGWSGQSFLWQSEHQ